MTDNYPIVDESGKTWTQSNPVNIYTTTSLFKFGDGCLHSLTSGGNIYTPWHDDFNFGSQNWTFELWARFGADASYGVAVGGDSFGDDVQFTFKYWGRTGSWSNMYWTYDNFITGDYFYVEDTRAPAVVNGQWYHIVWQRRGDSGELFLDGVNIGASVDFGGSTDFAITNYKWEIFPQSDPTGQIDEFRYSLGIARYPTVGFTPPTDPFTMDAYTKSLMHFDYQYVPPTAGQGQVILWKRKGV